MKTFDEEIRDAVLVAEKPHLISAIRVLLEQRNRHAEVRYYSTDGMCGDVHHTEDNIELLEALGQPWKSAADAKPAVHFTHSNLVALFLRALSFFRRR